ncbi:hypothetical protein [Fusobacterium varium]|uniref:hypothetical protein n=1 Tax=Fusobacterium varium TaxID=856 RepID=UPI00266B8130|nr:hypothetical protein [Fusobacterium varium]
MKYLITEEELKKLDKDFTEEKYEKSFMEVVEGDIELFLENYGVKLTEKEKSRFYKIVDEYGNDFYDENRVEEVMPDIIKKFLLQSKHNSNGTKILNKYFWR